MTTASADIGKEATFFTHRDDITYVTRFRVANHTTTFDFGGVEYTMDAAAFISVFERMAPWIAYRKHRVFSEGIAESDLPLEITRGIQEAFSAPEWYVEINAKHR